MFFRRQPLLGDNMKATTATLISFGVTVLIASRVALLITAWREDYAGGLCTLFLAPLP